MKTIKKEQFEVAMRQRGYTLAEISECIVSENGDTITINEQHPVYPKTAKPGAITDEQIREQQSKRQNPIGAGTFLSKMLDQIDAKVALSVNCVTQLQVMNAHGNDWCEQNIALITDFLQNAAHKRNLPISNIECEQMVKTAICLSRIAAKKQNESQLHSELSRSIP